MIIRGNRLAGITIEKYVYRLNLTRAHICSERASASAAIL